MSAKYLYPWLGLCLLLLLGCSGNRKKKSVDENLTYTEMEVKYAKGFTVKDYGDYKLVDVQDPLGENSSIYHYAFVKRGTSPQGIPTEYEQVEVPIRSAVCMTTLQLSNFAKLEAEDRVVGITSTRFLFNEAVNRQLKEGKTHKIGIEGDFDNELVIAINPDVILVSPFKKGGYESIKNLGIPLISFLGYKEVTPLGQAEWIKFTGALLGLEEEAKASFAKIEQRYLSLKDLVKDEKGKPTVLSGELHSGNWYVVGGKSYLATLFKDAGGKYFMDNDSESGGFYTDFETVYSQGAKADYWRILNSFDGEYSYDILRKSDERYIDFDAYKNKKVIYCNLREVSFYEKTPVEPEVVLADLIKIFYPHLLPDHEPVYYYLLK